MRAIGLFATAVIVLASFAPRAAAQSDSARSCAVCHLQWMQAFRDPDASVLITRPEKPAVADSNTCLGCHDGSVGDSRRRVWLEHGHRHGVAPPDGMRIPAKLPLADGQISCLTCHTAHAGRGPETIATAIFQRMNNEQSELCLACHQNRGGEGQLRHHPLTKMDQPVSAALRNSLARFGPDSKSVTCQSCHTPHGSQSEYLLINSINGEDNCAACHKTATPQYDTSHEQYHPFDALLPDDARENVSTWHPDLAGSDSLSCRSCHAMHNSKTDNGLLVETLENSALCLACHSSFEALSDSAHDLRVSAADEMNTANNTAAQTGQCSACHLVHQSARLTPDGAVTGGGASLNQRCTTCHAIGECGESAGGLTLHHPVGDESDAVHCARCHDPHDVSHPHFLRASPDAVCAECHRDQANRLGGGHAFSTRPDIRNGLNQTVDQTGQCGFCHSVHDATGPIMWAATATAPQSPEEYCTACHQPKGIAQDLTPQPMRHPRDMTGDPVVLHATATASLPLFDSGGRRDPNGAMACATCHDPHGDGDANRFLTRVEANSLCLTCHTQMAGVVDSPHGPASLSTSVTSVHSDVEVTSCRPCHAVHQMGDDPLLWSAPTDHSARLPDARYCFGCHNPSQIKTPHHVPIPVGGDMPLLTGDGAPAGMGWISCTTCHLPHGNSSVYAQINGADSSRKLPPNVIKAAKPLLRNYNPPNTCSRCHGFEGLIRFLQFHDFQPASP